MRTQGKTARIVNSTVTDTNDETSGLPRNEAADSRISERKSNLEGDHPSTDSSAKRANSSKANGARRRIHPEGGMEPHFTGRVSVEKELATGGANTENRTPEAERTQQEWILPNRGAIQSNSQTPGVLSPKSAQRTRAIRRDLESIFTEDRILRTLKRVAKRDTAAGIDGIRPKDLWKKVLEDKNLLKAIRDQILNQTYKFKPYRIVEIQKSNGNGTRVIAIPTAWDRVIQRIMADELFGIWGQKLSPNISAIKYRGTEDSLCKAIAFRRRRSTTLSLDIQNMFDEIEHRPLMKVLNRCPRWLKRMTYSLLKTPIRENCPSQNPAKGIPQGGPMSPLLANIYLHSMDQLMTEDKVDFVRYLDDVTVFLDSQDEAQAYSIKLARFVETSLGLKFNSSKTKICQKEQTPLLGFGLTCSGKIVLEPDWQGIETSSLEKFSMELASEVESNKKSIIKAMGLATSFINGKINHFITAEDFSYGRAKLYIDWHNATLEQLGVRLLSETMNKSGESKTHFLRKLYDAFDEHGRPPPIIDWNSIKVKIDKRRTRMRETINNFNKTRIKQEEL